MSPKLIIDATDFAAALLFILGLRQMSSPRTARAGIVVAGWGVLVATLAGFLEVFGVEPAARAHLGANLALAVTALVIGVAWAWWSGKRVAMTAMPQMVALYNGMG
ncbi:MAG: NAD(P)(+) transhydrogenase (Re/Si-specific) subunit beta, partial [Terriglobales bacterium]